ncbi:amidohydrolase [Cesiribacter sp. SM1]|uniref:amidohydrolase n=1 Tax=Cesiribacter sp. SM1 TaxID=2861196 RepID=UPI001CD7A90B|nr:amidohydrolase [Cesiribacter sp. SM1]
MKNALPSIVVEEISNLLPELTQLRRDLHKYPELSGQEEATARYVKAYLQRHMPARILTRLGATASGTGLAAVYEGSEEGPTLMFRADMDALPIPEQNHLPYNSLNKGVSHKCGHDGHMSMVAGLAPLLHRHPPKKGRVVLFMQPAEETGEGARALVQDPHFRELKPDYIFGLHNLPGYPLGQLVLREGTFCAASKGLRVVLTGGTAHAAEPERGISPAGALARLLQVLPALPDQLPHKELLLLTLTHAQMGEPSFGISPGQAVLQATLRANLEEEMTVLSEAVEAQIRTVAQEFGLRLALSYHEVFPVTQNNAVVSEILSRAAAAAGLSVHHKEEAFRWSEDFGHYNQLAPSGFFGLGSGTEQLNLHNASYDFPDALIPYGLKMYWALINELMGE